MESNFVVKKIVWIVSIDVDFLFDKLNVRSAKKELPVSGQI